MTSKPLEDDDDSAAAIPEWVVTFGDMMSLLLTFFIMLVSLSEVKEKETYQALVDSMRRRFGYENAINSLEPGESRPRTSEYAVLATTGRAKRADTATGGVPDPAPQGEKPKVRIVRPGRQTAVGAVVFFSVGSGELDNEAKRVLKAVAKQLRGKPQKIEIRGHVSAETAARAVRSGESMDLGYQRSRIVLQHLVDEQGIELQRFRLVSAGDSEPMHAGSDPAGMRSNSRVEVFMLDETVNDLRGTEDERADEVLTDHLTEEPDNG